MKKLVALLLAAMMVLAATGALADIVICQNKVEITSQMEAFAKLYEEKTGVPVKYTSGKKELLEQFLAEGGHDPKYVGTPLPIDIYMRRDWNSWISSLPEKRPQQLEYL